MSIIEMLLKEMDQEALTTRKMLERIPTEQLDFKPHERSMAMRDLATHIAELPSWVAMVLTTPELDFNQNAYTPAQVNNTAEVLELFEKSLDAGRSQLATAKEEDLEPNWTLRAGDTIYSSTTKYEMIRITYSQVVHHRAQLGVYLRLLNIPIPGSYGPSADEQGF